MNQRNSLAEFKDFLEPKMEIASVLPFWMRAIHEPVYGHERTLILTAITDRLNNNSNIPKTIIPHWQIDELESPPEPWRMVTRQQTRIVAQINSDDIYGIFANLLETHDYTKSISLTTDITFRYEDHGLGAIEYLHHFFSLDKDADKWLLFLHDVNYWREANEQIVNTLIETGSLEIQRLWPHINASFKQAIKDDDVFLELQEFRGKPPNLRGTKAVREDDICWTYGSNMILFRNMNLDFNTRRATELVRSIAEAYDDMPRDQSAIEVVSIGATSGRLEILSRGFGLVALVSQDDSDEPSRPSELIKAIWRQFHINYAAVTEAADGLYVVIAEAIARTSHQYQHEKYDGLRRLVAGIALIRYAAAPQNYEADDLEAKVYESASQAWGLQGAAESLRILLEDADRSTSRLAELVVQRENRMINRAVIVLTMLTIISVLQDLNSFTTADEHNTGGFIWKFLFSDKPVIIYIYLLGMLYVISRLWKTEAGQTVRKRLLMRFKTSWRPHWRPWAKARRK